MRGLPGHASGFSAERHRALCKTARVLSYTCTLHESIDAVIDHSGTRLPTSPPFYLFFSASGVWKITLTASVLPSTVRGLTVGLLLGQDVAGMRSYLMGQLC